MIQFNINLAVLQINIFEADFFTKKFAFLPLDQKNGGKVRL